MRNVINWLVIVAIALIIFSCSRYSNDQFEISYEEVDGLLELFVAGPEEGDIDIEVFEHGHSIVQRNFQNKKAINYTLFQLQTNREYEIKANFNINNQLYSKHLFYTRTTGNEGFNLTDSVFKSSNELSYYLIKPFNLETLVIVNNQGETVAKRGDEIGKMRGFSISDDSTVVFFADSTTIREVSFKGKMINEVSLKKYSDYKFNLHHDLMKYRGSYYAIVDNKGSFSSNGTTFRDEGFVQINEAGELIRFFNISEGNSLYKYNDKSTSFTGHANSIALDNELNVYLSLRNINQIWKINSDSEIVWSMGLFAKDYPLDLDQSFLGQHSIKMVSSDNFLIYDNSAYKSISNAKIRNVKVGESKLINEVVVNLTDELSTIRMGSVDEHEDILTVSAFKRGFHIVDFKDNEVVNHLKLNENAKSIKVYRLNAEFLEEVLNTEPF